MKSFYQPNQDIDLILEESDLQKFIRQPLEGLIDKLNKKIKLDYNISIKERTVTVGKNSICVTVTGEDYDKICIEKNHLSFRYDGEHRMLIFCQNK